MSKVNGGMTDDEIFMRLEFCDARLGRLRKQVKIARWRGDSDKVVEQSLTLAACLPGSLAHCPYSGVAFRA